MTRTLRLVAAAALFSATVGVPAGARVVDGVAAVVNGDVITRSEVRAQAELVQMMAGVAGEEARDQALDALIEKTLLQKEAQRLGLAVDEEDVDRAIEEIRERNGLSPEAFRSALAGQGLEFETYREEIRAQVRKARLAGRVLRSKMQVGDSALREYFLKNVADYRERDAVHLLHIQIPADRGREAAEEARRRALAGEDFADLARELSSGAGAEEGGDMGILPVDSLSTEVRAVVWDLKPGEVSPVVDIRGGDYHLFYVAGRRPGRIPDFEEVRGRVRDHFFEDRQEELYRTWIDSLREKATIDRKI